MTRRPKILLSLSLAALLHAGATMAAEHPSTRYATNLPPPVLLHYTIKADRSGLSLSGDATVKWQTEGAGKGQSAYTIATETHAAIVGKILDAGSSGQIDEWGLAPTQYHEKPRNKDMMQANFDRQAKQIRFTSSADVYPILGGEQDRSSVIWQLISVARAQPKKFVPKSTWQFFVAGRHDAEPWTFSVEETVTMNTALGSFETVHLVKAPPPDSKDQRLDIWLAPGLEWYPVRLKFSDADGDTIDQRLDQVQHGNASQVGQSNNGNQP